jgi:hypothetical protein
MENAVLGDVVQTGDGSPPLPGLGFHADRHHPACHVWLRRLRPPRFPGRPVRRCAGAGCSACIQKQSRGWRGRRRSSPAVWSRRPAAGSRFSMPSRGQHFLPGSASPTHWQPATGGGRQASCPSPTSNRGVYEHLYMYVSMLTIRMCRRGNWSSSRNDTVPRINLHMFRRLPTPLRVASTDPAPGGRAHGLLLRVGGHVRLIRRASRVPRRVVGGWHFTRGRGSEIRTSVGGEVVPRLLGGEGGGQEPEAGEAAQAAAAGVGAGVRRVLEESSLVDGLAGRRLGPRHVARRGHLWRARPGCVRLECAHGRIIEAGGTRTRRPGRGWRQICPKGTHSPRRASR